MRLSFPGLYLGAAVACLSCASSSQGSAGGAEAASYKKSLGTAALTDIVRQVPKIFNRHQYEIERADSSPSYMTIQTRWNGRYPLQDEIDSGVTEAATRLIVTARARARTGGTADVRVVELLAENRVLIGDSTQRRYGFMTPMFREYVDRIAEELKTELLTGVRVY